MSSTDTQFAGSIPTLYEQYLVPLLFAPYAEEMAKRVAALAPSSVLETTAGTGVLTRALARSLPQGTRIVATDLNDAMIAIGAEHLPSLTWKQADAQALPFDDGAFDVVASQFGMMFPPDRVLAYREARRVLAPGGTFVFDVWDRLDANEVTRIVVDAVGELFPDDPPRFLDCTPHGYYDVARIRDDLGRAGFERIEIEHLDAVTRGTCADAAEGLCKGTPMRPEIEARARGPGALDEATARAAEALTARFGGPTLENRMRALVVTARDRGK